MHQAQQAESQSHGKRKPSCLCGKIATMKPIAHIHTDMPQKFGIPRNSFLAPHLRGTIIFEPEFALNSAVEGMEGFTHLWLIWEFENGTPGGTAADIANDVQSNDKRGTTEKWFPT